MKSYIVYGDSETHCGIEEMPMPAYGPYDCLVKMESCGICSGTDMKILHHAFKGVEQYPVVLGHEGVGRVVATGSKVCSFLPGDLVLLPFWEDVPEGYASAWGSFSEYGTVRDAAAMERDGMVPPDSAYAQKKLPAGFDPVGASMIITFREVLSTMKQFGMKENQSLFVLGLGPVGLSFVRFAKLMGMGTVIAADVQEEKLLLAQKQGADFVFNSRSRDIESAVREICPEGVDYALDAVGIPSFIRTALGCIRPEGKVCVYGISETMNAPLDWSACPYNWTLQFHHFPSKKAEGEAHAQIVAWIAAGALDPMDFISHVFPFAEIETAFDRLRRHLPSMKMVIRF